MNYKKLILVGCISAFVALLTSVLGVAGTVIGSVISSVMYNMLSEALEKPVEKATFSTKFEWEIAYIFPLVVIALIQLLLIFALLSEWGMLPVTFLNAYLSLQHFAENNLYRILGLAMLVISIYPLVVKPDIIKKSHGIIIAFVGVIFLARGFVDVGNRITNLYDIVFVYFDFPIAVIALILILFVIYKILVSARQSEKEFRIIKNNTAENTFADSAKRVHHSPKHEDFDYEHKSEPVRPNRHRAVNRQNPKSNVHFRSHVSDETQKGGINESSDKIKFESNDLINEYKK